MVAVSPQSRTIVVPPGAVRTCITCKLTRPLEQFAIIHPGAGTIDRRRLCAPCIERVDGMLDAGERNISAIQRATGVSAATIRARRDELGLEGRQYRRLSDIDALTELTLADHDTSAIAARLNVEEHTVRRHQVDLGLREAETKFGPVSDEQLARAGRMLREERASYRETARTVRADVDTLRRHFPGLGFTAEDKSTIASVLATPDLRRLHEEFFGRTLGDAA